MYTIGIDARLYGLKHAGIGRYIQNLVNQLAKIDNQNHYILFVSNIQDIDPLPHNFTLVSAPIKHYTFKEQIDFPKLIKSFDLDLVHFPHFNTPFKYNGPYVVTIHDLLWHEKIGFNATTLPAIKYLIKYFGYRLVIKNAIKRSQKVITPTKHVAAQIHQKFSIPKSKIKVTYESASQTYLKPHSKKPIPAKFNLTPPFVIYTGSLYPHKNVNTLIDSLEFVNQDISLVIVSARNIFLEKTKDYVNSKQLSQRVKFLGFVSDKDLANLYQHALALVQPSQSEGFGLTGLEAMAAGLPVIASKHSVMTEVYSKAAIYTDTSKPSLLADSINKLHNNPTNRPKLVKLGKLQAQKYSWKKMAEETLAIYLKTLNTSQLKTLPK